MVAGLATARGLGPDAGADLVGLGFQYRWRGRSTICFLQGRAPSAEPRCSWCRVLRRDGNRAAASGVPHACLPFADQGLTITTDLISGDAAFGQRRLETVSLRAWSSDA